jgi:hypothetical protein
VSGDRPSPGDGVVPHGDTPGRFKERPNQAGSYVFVAPRLVQGTLIEGFRRLADLPPGFPRAAYELFVVSEVHPYDDGNGRWPGRPWAPN